jgi:hypothetical protein
MYDTNVSASIETPLSSFSRTRPCMDRMKMGILDDKARAAFVKSAIWDNGSTLRVFFLDGTKQQQDWVSKVIKTHIEPIVNLKFVWSNETRLNPRDCPIRISFNPNEGAWSLLGRDALTERSPSNPTMNLGWIDDELDYDPPGPNSPAKGSGAVVIHEFGHALGMIHEHSSPNTSIQWRCNRVLNATCSPPNRWDVDTTIHNIFNRYDTSEINASVYDPKSIMHYWYPAEWICNSDELNLSLNVKLSELDKIWLAKMYPKM